MPATRRSAGKESHSPSASASPYLDAKGRRSPRLNKPTATACNDHQNESHMARSAPPKASARRKKPREIAEEQEAQTEPRDPPSERHAEAEFTTLEGNLEGLDLDKPLYVPHGKWAYTEGQDFVDVEAIKRLSHGAQAEVWYNSAVVEGGPRFDYIAKKWSVWSEWRGFFTEIYLYSSPNHLRDLQGDIVPYFIGIHNTPGGYVTFAMEPICPEGWNEASNQMSPDVREMVATAWMKLHAKGILHNDVELRHMLISDDCTQVQIIDFQESRSLYPCEAVGLKPCTQEELHKEFQKVLKLIDWKQDGAATRRQNNRVRHNWRRQCRREVKAGTWEVGHNDPEWLQDIEDISDDEEHTDKEWQDDLSDSEVRDDDEYEGYALGRRFNVPDEEYREKLREMQRDVQRKIQAQIDYRDRMEVEKGAKEPGSSTPRPSIHGSTVGHPNKEPPSEKRGVHFIADDAGSEDVAEVEIKTFKTTQATETIGDTPITVAPLQPESSEESIAEPRRSGRLADKAKPEPQSQESAIVKKSKSKPKPKASGSKQTPKRTSRDEKSASSSKVSVPEDVEPSPGSSGQATSRKRGRTSDAGRHQAPPKRAAKEK